MARFKFTLSIGFAGAKQESVVTIPDEELEGLSAEKREEEIYNRWLEWIWQYIDGTNEEIAE